MTTENDGMAAGKLRVRELRGGKLRVLLLAALLAVALCALAWPTAAFAADENEVNERQLPDSSFIYDTSISDLGGADSYYNNQTVQVVGEVVGDAINADFDGSHKWITLAATDGSTVSVYMSSDSASRIDLYGAYGKTGTTLQVRGTFHLACKEHEGLSDLHADHVSVVKKGVVHADEFDVQTFVPGIACVVVGLLLLFAFYRLRERQR